MSYTLHHRKFIFVRRLILVVGFLLQSLVFLAQQGPDCIFKMKGNAMYLEISKKIGLSSIDSFARKYSIADIGLYELIVFGKTDSLKKNGWKIDTRDHYKYRMTKSLEAINNIRNPEGRIVFTAVPTPDNWRVVAGNKIGYGVNQFRGEPSVKQEKDVLTFFLSGFTSAKMVRLAGSFTNWQWGAFPMVKTDSGWIIKVQLGAGPHYYKFIINDDKWIVDPANKLVEDDGRGNINSVMYAVNKVFLLEGYKDAKKVSVAGSFNNWTKEKIFMKNTQVGWVVDMFLEPGTHEFEYWVDGKRVETEKGNDTIAKGKEVTTIGTEYVFKLKGYQDAKRVIVSGNFNEWSEKKLSMKKTEEGWELSYALGAGNIQYKFIVDGNWILDPSNPTVVDDGKGNKNSFIVIGANHEFVLNGFGQAKQVFLSGTFSEWCVDCLPMKWAGTGWKCQVYLARGKQLYKFIVDGKWIIDPANKNWEENEFGGSNSVMWKE